jgi:surface antigen
MKALSAVLLALFIAGCNATAGTGKGTLRTASTGSYQATPYQGSGSRDAEFALLGKFFSLSRLIAARLGKVLDVSDAGGLDSASSNAISGLIHARHAWSTSHTGNSGQVTLARRDNRGGRECALLHHSHVVDKAKIRGSLMACRQPNGPWILDDTRWTRSGDDFAEPSRKQKPAKGNWRAVTE